MAIERKTRADACDSLGRRWARVRKVAGHMVALEYEAVVIAAGMPDFLRVPVYCQLALRSARNRLLAWSVRFSVYAFFADSCQRGADLTLQLLQNLWQHHGRSL